MPTFAEKLQQAIKHLSQNDPVMADLISRYPLCQIQPHENYYQELVDAIISQQLSVKAASSIERKFCALFGNETSFPQPSEILEKSIDELRTAGLSRAKATYVQDLARHVQEGEITFDRFPDLSNDEIIKELVAVKGIGEWTAHMFLIFSLGRLDVLPVGDLGIRNGIKLLYDFDHLPKPEEMRAIAAQNSWQPYESVASWYIWQSLDNVPKT
ncbi:MAG: DNA-3-methyladenine glycosylase [Candidatus Saccharibacteria bacterium]|nr:DNA-3-methyladenine glycosylase [Candidatus Saccharibacteria bacterium]